METKKKPEVNIYLKKPLFFNIGLVTALALVISAFEYKTYDATIVDLEFDDTFYIKDEIIPDIPNTYVKPTPPTPPVMKETPKVSEEIVEVKDDPKLLLPELPTVEVDPGEVPTASSEVFNNAKPDMDEKVEEPTIFIAEEMPAFGKNAADFYKYLSKNIKYPSQAQNMGIEGKVFVQFVVDKDGSITNVEVIKGIGGGCDEEAVRVLQNSPKWQPGKQGGRPVRVRMTMPIVFSLQK